MNWIASTAVPARKSSEVHYSSGVHYSVEVISGGHTFLVRPSMAEIFVRTARRVLARGESELVVLLHKAGVDLILICSKTQIAVVDRSQVDTVCLWVSPTPGNDMLGVPAAAVSDAIQTGKALTMADVHDRILMALYPLFSRYSVRELSWAQLQQASGVTVEELQREFGSLELFVGECLKVLEREWAIGLIGAGVHERATAADDKLLAIFDEFDKWFHRDDYEACTFISVLLEMGKTHSLGRASATHLRYIRSILTDLAVEAGLRDPEQFALSWHLLMKGSIINAVEGDTDAAKRAKEMGIDLIARYRVHNDTVGLGSTQQSQTPSAAR